MDEREQLPKIKHFKFEFGGMYTHYAGHNLGEALLRLIADRTDWKRHLLDLESVTEVEGVR